MRPQRVLPVLCPCLADPSQACCALYGVLALVHKRHAASFATEVRHIRHAAVIVTAVMAGCASSGCGWRLRCTTPEAGTTVAPPLRYWPARDEAGPTQATGV